MSGHANADTIYPDRLPTCPACGDLNRETALQCENCGGRLTLLDHRNVNDWRRWLGSAAVSVSATRSAEAS